MVLLAACARPGASASETTRTATARDTSTRATVASAEPTTAATAAPGDAHELLVGKAIEPAEFRRLVTTLSEPDAEFISDNLISNETSYLQVAELLPRVVTQGGVYVGVGPEQNFSYIALARPAYAYLVDIRRANMVQHLLYKAVFDEASSRAHFLSLLFARPYEAMGDPGATGKLEQVIAHAEAPSPASGTFEPVHARLLARIEGGYGIELDPRDRAVLKKIHRTFAQKGLDLRFELRERSFRKYPTLRELMLQTSPEGTQHSFLASEDTFRLLQRMQRENRIIPIVGDFAGDRAMPELAAHLIREGQTVSAFYVSNVEQYLLTGAVWWKWRRNIEALPTDESSLFIRAYLDQGQRHPQQLDGHRTATTLQRIAHFERHKGRYPSLFALSTDELVR
jgi:hypothetical protein